jgi:hypothetical protein
MTPPKGHNSSATEPKDVEMIAMPDKAFKSLVLKLISDLKKNSNKQTDK